MPDHNALASRILDAALALGERTSWEAVTLAETAHALDVGLDDLRRHFPQKDDLVEAWFDRADAAMLSAAEPTSDRPPAEGVHSAIMCWLGALAAHRRVTGEMLLYKLEPGHFHLQALGMMRISRTVQWIREAAGLDATGLRRIAEELVLTGIYIATFGYWLTDASADVEATARFLNGQLEAAGPFMW